MCGPGVATGYALFVALADASALLQPICEELRWYTPDTNSGDVVHAAPASQLCAPRKTSTSNGSATWGFRVRILHVRGIPAVPSWTLFAGTGRLTDTDDNDSDDGRNVSKRSSVSASSPT